MDELLTDGTRYVWRSLRPGAGGSGRVTPDVLARLLPLALPPEQWVGLLLGCPLPGDDPWDVLDCAGATQEGCVDMRWRDGRRVRLWILESGVVDRGELEDTGHVQQAKVVYQWTGPDGPGGPPSAMWLTGGSLDGTRPAQLTLTDVRLNGEPPPSQLFAPLALVP
jgi:hypothetical protein